MATASDHLYGTPAPASTDQGHADLTLASKETPDTAEYTDFPCSVAQERFWLLDRLEPGNPSYNVAVRWRLEGRVSTALLEAAWLEIAARHEILRTRFIEIDGKPVQRVAAHASFKLVEIDLSTLTPDARPAEGDRIGIIEARAPFDLEGGPLLRVVLLRHSPTMCVILVTTHQIVSDGWSIGVMAREMGTIYEALSAHKPAPLEPLPIQYGDYSLWQLEWLRQRGTDAETAYWSRQLSGVSPFEVLADRPRPAVPTTSGAIASLVLPRELTNRMQALSAERGVTLFAAAVATLCATLSRYTGKPEIVVGTQVSDRDQVELESMIGQFVNSLILRNDVRGNPTFNELLERISTTIAEALEHRHIPIERLLGMVKVGRGGSNSPPISVNFIFQRTFIENRSYGEFDLVDLPSLPAGAIYDLNFFMVERPDGWRFSCQFNTDQFEAATANRLLRYFQAALESAVQSPRRRISELRLADAAEANQFTGRLTGPAMAHPGSRTIAAQITARAGLAPDSVALVCGDRRLTYAQLDTESERLARHLQTRGIGPGTRVALCLERSTELVVAMLAALKSGAAYVPLDPSDPPAYRQRLIDLSGATLALTTPALAPTMRAKSGVICDFRLPGADSTISLPQVAATAAAAVWFTASDPDQPAAVEISQLGLLNLLTDLQQRLGISPADNFISLGSLTCDSAPVELLLPLLSGARIVLAAADETGDPKRLQHLLKRSNVTVMYAAHGASSLLSGGMAPNQRFAKIICDRGSIEPELAARLLECSGELWALQGFIETSGCASVQRVQQPHDLRLLGEPLANTRIRVLDGSLKPPPLGAQGQLYVGGVGVAAEYLVGRSENRFILDPGEGEAGTRLFRTGQSARVRADGAVEVIADELNPLRPNGYRIATNDITLALEALPNVREAAAIAAGAAGTNRLTAFVVWQESGGADQGSVGADTALAEVRSKVTATWPRAAQPDEWVAVDALPRMSSGAVDLRRLLTSKNALPRPDAQSLPDGETEQRLASIWAELLGQGQIDPTANFFELGGHSLLAARMLARVEAQFGRRVTLAALFRAPTIRGLAHLLQHDARDFDFRQMVKLQADGANLPLIAINNTGVYYLLAKRLGTQQPVTSLQVFDPSARHETLPGTLEEIAAEYVQLIQRVHPQGPYVLAGWCVAGALAFEIARQLVAAGQPVRQLFLIDSWVPGYFARLHPLRRAIGGYSLRWQLASADWRRFTSGQQTFAEFLRQRVLVKRLSALFAPKAPDAMPTAPDAASATPAAIAAAQSGQSASDPEDYDRWLLEYLKATTNRYEPKTYSGRITLFRSTQEPTGWLFDPLAGWGAYAAGGVELALVKGNHFTMFQDPGATQMAAHMSKLIGPAS